MDTLTKRYGPRLKTSNAATNTSNNFNSMSSAVLTDMRTTDQLIRAIVKTQSREKDLKSIEYQLIKQRYKMSLPVALDACHAFYKVQHAMPSYLPALFSVIEETFQSMQPSPEDITFLFLYVFLHGSAPEMLFHMVEEYLLKHLHHFHINDLGVISAGFFRANHRIMSQDLLEVMAHKLLMDFSFVDPYLLMTFMKVYRHASYVRISFYNKLADSLMKDNYLTHYNSTNSLMHIAFTYASIPIVHKELFEQLLCRFEALLNQKPNTRTKDLSKFVWACGTLQFKPHDYQQRFRRLANHFELSSVEQFPESLAELLFGLIYLEIFPEDLLSRCLSQDVINRLADSAADKEKSFQLLILNETMKIECPLYSGPTLLQSQRQVLLEHLALSKDMEVELQIRIGLAAVLTSLQISLGTERVRCHFPLPHFRTAGETTPKPILTEMPSYF
ncbi:hypothetical protein C0Q70_20352 [Pomacea canaliculata]|uniref:FAST kinase leucine-rich domain-containing protein n=1 Tax=Pomacea canaliculata TaxID=400727 RepID=A0A2T7NFA0_POMCA|nr:hypothetical protein C0Q70_20352 [Pomacea canaliculata]